MIIRKMELEDIDAVVAMEHELFTSPWSKEDLVYEITKNGVNKASAVSWLADFLNISKEEVAVYGDGGNDIMMLSSFKHSYTPSTGSIEAKEAASQIIGPYEDYSVIEHILNTIEEEKKIE